MHVLWILLCLFVLLYRNEGFKDVASGRAMSVGRGGIANEPSEGIPEGEVNITQSNICTTQTMENITDGGFDEWAPYQDNCDPRDNIFIYNVFQPLLDQNHPNDKTYPGESYGDSRKTSSMYPGSPLLKVLSRHVRSFQDVDGIHSRYWTGVVEWELLKKQRFVPGWYINLTSPIWKAPLIQEYEIRECPHNLIKPYKKQRCPSYRNYRPSCIQLKKNYFGRLWSFGLDESSIQNQSVQANESWVRSN